jgi:phosphodiester glycosidase
MKVSIILIILGLMPGLVFASELPLPEYKKIADGVWYGEVKEKDPLIFYHVIKVDLSVGKAAVRPIRPRKDETLGQMAARFDSEKLPLLGAITGDYYHSLKEYKLEIPWGVLIEDGKLLFSPSGKSALCSNAEGGFDILVPTMEARLFNKSDSPGVSLTAVNRRIKPGGTERGIYNSTWGAFAPEIPKGFAVTIIGDSEFRLDHPARGTVTGISRLPVSAPIPENGFVMIMEELPSPDQLELKLGSQVVVNIQVSSSPSNAIGGGPRLVRAGKISIELRREKFGTGIAFYIKNSLHPRSAVGIAPEARILFLVVVEGRSDESRGMTMKELSRLLLSLGASEAMAFDGGRSVSMYVNGKEVVKADRPMADALGIFYNK